MLNFLLSLHHSSTLYYWLVVSFTQDFRSLPILNIHPSRNSIIFQFRLYTILVLSPCSTPPSHFLLRTLALVAWVIIQLLEFKLTVRHHEILIGIWQTNWHKIPESKTQKRSQCMKNKRDTREIKKWKINGIFSTEMMKTEKKLDEKKRETTLKRISVAMKIHAKTVSI